MARALDVVDRHPGPRGHVPAASRRLVSLAVRLEAGLVSEEQAFKAADQIAENPRHQNPPPGASAPPAWRVYGDQGGDLREVWRTPKGDPIPVKLTLREIPAGWVVAVWQRQFIDRKLELYEEKGFRTREEAMERMASLATFFENRFPRENPLADTLIRGGRKARELARKGAKRVGEWSAREAAAACRELGYTKGNPLTDVENRRARIAAMLARKARKIESQGPPPPLPRMSDLVHAGLTPQEAFRAIEAARRGNPLTDDQHREAGNRAEGFANRAEQISQAYGTRGLTYKADLWEIEEGIQEGAMFAHRAAVEDQEWPPEGHAGQSYQSRERELGLLNVTPGRGPTFLPLAPENRKWNAAAARKRIKRWATTKGKIDWGRYARAFLYRRSTKPDQISAFKLPIADVIGGRLHAVPRAIEAAHASLDGARGGVDIPHTSRQAAKRWVDVYYRKMGRVAPWEGQECR